MKNPLKCALLLEDNWGSGKTYFVQNELEKLKELVEKIDINVFNNMKRFSLNALNVAINKYIEILKK